VPSVSDEGADTESRNIITLQPCPEPEAPAVRRGGRVQPGTAPHRNARFEAPVPEEPAPAAAAAPSGRAGPQGKMRRESSGGNLPHRGSRFEPDVPGAQDVTGAPVITPTDTLDFHNDHSRDVHPNWRGRRVSGTTPHKGARFELPNETLSGAAVTRPPAGAPNHNPFRGNRKPAGVSPPRGARYDFFGEPAEQPEARAGAPPPARAKSGLSPPKGLRFEAPSDNSGTGPVEPAARPAAGETDQPVTGSRRRYFNGNRSTLQLF